MIVLLSYLEEFIIKLASSANLLANSNFSLYDLNAPEFPFIFNILATFNETRSSLLIISLKSFLFYI